MFELKTYNSLYLIIIGTILVFAGLMIRNGISKNKITLLSTFLMGLGAIVILYHLLSYILNSTQNTVPSPKIEPFGMGFSMIMGRAFGGLFGGGSSKTPAEKEAEAKRKAEAEAKKKAAAEAKRIETKNKFMKTLQTYANSMKQMASSLQRTTQPVLI